MITINISSNPQHTIVKKGNKMMYYIHKQADLGRCSKNNLKKIVSLVNSLDPESEIAQKLRAISNDMAKEMREYSDRVEIVSRRSHSHKDQEYLTVKFIKKNLTIEIDTETFNQFYCPARF